MINLEQKRLSSFRGKDEIDMSLLNEALCLDRDIYTSELRPIVRDLTAHPSDFFYPIFTTSKLQLDPLKLLPPVISNYRRNKTAFMPIPDGSTNTYASLAKLASQDNISFDQAANSLHALGVSRYLGEILSPRNLVRLAQGGVRISDIVGTYRTLNAGFEYSLFHCTHPNAIGSEMKTLGAKVDTVVQTVREIPKYLHEDDMITLRQKLANTRFCTVQRIQQLTDKELFSSLVASEMQRILAYIHPWYERVGRTSEECMGLVQMRCGVNPLFLSMPENRSTLEGYERGILLGITAIGFLRETGKRFGLSENQISNIFKVRDLYNQLPDRQHKKVIYKTPLKYVYGRNIFPDSEIMRQYYEITHQIIMGLINTFNVATIMQDPYTIYLTGHLISRGKYLTEKS